ncbi:FAD:protein FMN transferase [Streptomyces sp. GC420]|uniref:FAD:protein FMN transferase n=1 Tax=Streptomyces sp. GC420 TaxID=2697568 RepID=UPI001414EE36|nr:FAD:protein FMN transferase [Streptomyces sp. GC420]NBM15508.1 FAD:protein FMN transferase [Streptomyces sp. GC420]
MGTVFSFDVRMGPDTIVPRVQAGLGAAVAGLHRVDEVFSTYRPDSQVSRLSRGELALGDCVTEVAEVLRQCEEEERLSDGWFTARYDGSLDPTGLVKGWAVERAVRMLASAGAGSVCLNGGGDIQLHGGPWRVGISDPLNPGGLVTVVESVEGLAVATSGPAERGCHILDPRTRRAPAEGLASITVVCPGLTQADARATAAYAMGARAARGWLEDLPDTEGFAVAADGSTWQTSGFARHTAKLTA